MHRAHSTLHITGKQAERTESSPANRKSEFYYRKPAATIGKVCKKVPEKNWINGQGLVIC